MVLTLVKIRVNLSFFLIQCIRHCGEKTQIPNSFESVTRTCRNACRLSFLNTATAAMAKLSPCALPHSLRRRVGALGETQKCVPKNWSPCASSPPDILGPSEALKDHFLGFDKDFGGPPASQEEDLLL